MRLSLSPLGLFLCPRSFGCLLLSALSPLLLPASAILISSCIDAPSKGIVKVQINYYIESFWSYCCSLSFVYIHMLIFIVAAFFLCSWRHCTHNENHQVGSQDIWPLNICCLKHYIFVDFAMLWAWVSSWFILHFFILILVFLIKLNSRITVYLF